MIYSNEEIELTLNLYSIAKSHINELNQMGFEKWKYF